MANYTKCVQFSKDLDMDDGEARIFDDKCIEDCPYHCSDNWKYSDENIDGANEILTDKTLTFKIGKLSL